MDKISKFGYKTYKVMTFIALIMSEKRIKNSGAMVDTYYLKEPWKKVNFKLAPYSYLPNIEMQPPTPIENLHLHYS